MRKKVFRFVAICLILIVASSAFFVVRKINYDYGRDRGYLIGYSIGYIDQCNGVLREPARVAPKIVPYEIESSKWKGFIIGFSEGYSDGYQLDYLS